MESLTAGLWLPHLLSAGIEPTGNMVKKRAEFTVETRSAGQGEVLVYVEDPAGHQEEVELWAVRAGHCSASIAGTTLSKGLWVPSHHRQR